MRYWRRHLLFLVGIGGCSLLLHVLPDDVTLPLFCRLPAEIASAWFAVPLDRETLTYIVHHHPFAITRTCAATGFFSIALMLLLIRRAPWAWFAYPLTLAVNSLRIIAATLLTLALNGFRYERLAHMALGTFFFVSTLVLLWFFTERPSDEHP